MTRDLTGKAKPCPMCGSKRIYMPYPVRIYMPYPVMAFMYSVKIQCADCGLNGYKNFTEKVNMEEAMNRTVEYWNTRC